RPPTMRASSPHGAAAALARARNSSRLPSSSSGLPGTARTAISRRHIGRAASALLRVRQRADARIERTQARIDGTELLRGVERAHGVVAASFADARLGLVEEHAGELLAHRHN